MGLLDKVKNLFTEEVEEEIKPIKNEVRHIEVEAPKRELREEKIEIEEEPVEEKKEEKFVFFSDDDFKDLERKEVEPRPVVQEKSKQMYRSTIIEEETPKMFKPSPIISPVYGVLDKNYSKEEVVSKKVVSRPVDPNMSVDDVRRKAYGTIEDDFKETFAGKNIEPEEVAEVSNIDIFEELEKYDNLDALEEKIENKDKVDDIFDSLDNKKEEILDELDNKKDEILDELDSKKEDIITNDSSADNNDLDDLDLDEETLELSRQLETAKKRLDEINDIIPEEEKEEPEEPKDEDLNESELFDLIDSMYDKKDDE